MSHAIAHESTLDDALDQSGRAFFGLFLFSLILVSIPIKNFAYVLPPLFLAAQLLWSDTAAATRTLLLALLVTVVSCSSLFIDAIRGQTTNPPGVFVGLVTFLPLLMMTTERFRRPVDDALFQRILNVVAWYVIVQAVIGLLQLAATGNPDAVTGTLGLLDFHTGAITIAQVYFGFLILGMVLFLMLDARTLLTKIGIAAGMIAAAASQSGHQCIFFVAALALWAILQTRRVAVMLAVGTLAAGLFVLVLVLYPATIDHSRQWYAKTVDNPGSPKRLALEGAGAILSDPKNLFLGTGFGQYSSRAALITSGEFLSVPLPHVVTGQSDYYRQYLVPGMDIFEQQGEGSAISKPYFSGLSVLVEFGLVLSLVVVAALAWNLVRALRMMYSPHPRMAQAGMLACTGITFLLLCCLVENYVEFPQAVFVPYLLYVVGVSWARQTSDPHGSERDALPMMVLATTTEFRPHS